MNQGAQPPVEIGFTAIDSSHPGEAEELRALLSVAQVVVSSLELDEVLQNILFSAMGFIDMPAGSIALYEEATNQLSLHAHAGLSDRVVAKKLWLVKDGGLTHRILSEGELFVVEDTASAGVNLHPMVREEGIRSLVAVPLKIQNKMVGILYLNDFVPRRFPIDRLELLSILGSFATLSIDNAQLHEQTRKMACTDGLTGLYNHRHFKKVFQEEMVRAARYNSPLSLIMFDVDDFKHFNDRYGHPNGDKVLAAVGDILRGLLRGCDLAFRYGGEEFVVILPETTIDKALAVAERVRKAIENYSAHCLDGVPDDGVTVSVGVACRPRDGNSPDQLLQAVDKLLYQAKGLGKNKVHHLPV